jgi:hypothetical protein
LRGYDRKKRVRLWRGIVAAIVDRGMQDAEVNDLGYRWAGDEDGCGPMFSQIETVIILNAEEIKIVEGKEYE